MVCGEVLEDIDPIEVDKMMCKDNTLSYAEKWIGKKAREQVINYRGIDPTFKIGYKYLEYVSELKPSVQRWRVYQPLGKWIRTTSLQH